MVDELINQFLTNKVNPKGGVIAQAEESQKTFREILVNKLNEIENSPDLLDGHDFLFGSAIRGTKPAPFDDIDLMLILDGSGLTPIENGYAVGSVWGTGKAYNPISSSKYLTVDNLISSQKVLNHIREVVDKTPYTRSDIRKDNQAITIWMETYGFGIDVVPAFKIDHNTHGTHYYIPFGTNSDMWQSTNPHMDLSAFELEDGRLGGVLCSSAKLMRIWNKVNNAERLSGFHIDALVYRSLVGKNITSIQMAISECFKNFSALLDYMCPQFSGFQPDIDHKLSWEDRQKSKQAVVNAWNSIQKANLMVFTGSPDNAKFEWNRIFANKLLT